MRHTILTLITLLFILSGCKSDSTVEQIKSKETTSIQFSTKAIVGEVSDGVKIEKVRLILISDQNKVILNATTENGQLTDENGVMTTSDIALDRYNYLLVVNESFEMTEAFSLASEISHVVDVIIEWQESKFTELNIPLASWGELYLKTSSDKTALASVAVYNPEERWYYDDICYESPQYLTNVVIPVYRVLPKVSLYLRKDNTVVEDVKITRVDITNMPNYSFVAYRYGHSEIARHSGTTAFMDAGTGVKLSSSSDDPTTGGYKKLFGDLILPENYLKYRFSDSNEAHAYRLVIHATRSGEEVVFDVPIGESSDNFNFLRNNHYNVYATVSHDGRIDFSIKVIEWNDGGIVDVVQPDFDEKIYLNVSQLAVVESIAKSSESEESIFFASNLTEDRVSVEQFEFEFHTATGIIKTDRTLAGLRDFFLSAGNSAEVIDATLMPKIEIAEEKMPNPTFTSNTIGSVKIKLTTPSDIQWGEKVVISYYIKAAHLNRKVTLTYNLQK